MGEGKKKKKKKISFNKLGWMKFCPIQFGENFCLENNAKQKRQFHELKI
jgi:hypothetical protein